MIRWLVARLWSFACRVQAWQDRQDTDVWLANVRSQFPVGAVVRISRTKPAALWIVHSYDTLGRVVRLYGAEHGPRLGPMYWPDIPLSVRAIGVPARLLVLEPQAGPEAT